MPYINLKKLLKAVHLKYIFKIILMKNISLIVASFLLFISCNKKLEDSKIKDVTKDSLTVNSSEIAVEEIGSLCYYDDIKNDSIYLKITDNLGTITGKMRYKNFVKDHPTGDVMGFMSGDTLKLSYIYNAEGASLQKEIWFLKKNEQLVEGIGNKDEEGNYTSFKNVKFENGHSLQPVDCGKIANYLK